MRVYLEVCRREEGGDDEMSRYAFSFFFRNVVNYHLVVTDATEFFEAWQVERVAC